MSWLRSYQRCTDEELVQLMRQGKRQAFDALHQRYQERMYRYFFTMLQGNRMKAQDFTQDVFFRVIKNAGLFNPQQKFSTWIYTIANNLCKNEYRRMSRNPMTVELKNEEFPIDLMPWQQLDQKGFEKALRQQLEQLDELPRQCFILRFQEELSIKEISEILNCPEGTVKSRLHYTIKKLSTRLQVFNPKQ